MCHFPTLVIELLLLDLKKSQIFFYCCFSEKLSKLVERLKVVKLIANFIEQLTDNDIQLISSKFFKRI